MFTARISRVSALIASTAIVGSIGSSSMALVVGAIALFAVGGALLGLTARRRTDHG